YIADKDTKEILFAGEYAYPERYSGSNTTESTTEIPSESTSETTEVFTDPTTEATTDVISWQRPDLAVWQLFSGEGEYEYKLFDSNGRVIDKRTINCSDEENSHQPYHCFAENTEVFEKYGEGLYSFSVSRNGKTLVSDFYFYSPKQDGLASAISSETPQDCIAFSLTNMFPWNNWEYRITNADKVTAVSSNEYHGKAEYQNPYKTETLDMHYQQLIFRPVKPGVVTFRLTQTESPLDPTVTAEAEYSYIIDSGLNVHVYMPSEGYLSGDADNDGKLTAADSANTLQKALISTFETPVELCDKENYTVMKGNTVYDRAAVMDMNKNGCIDADDSARILQATLTGTVG
ncbi:MAG: hypothetical protein IJ736_16060, partial [Firmicutes bacterium]|nr:hypothetical protein [Bacillota bacterium]